MNLSEIKSKVSAIATANQLAMAPTEDEKAKLVPVKVSQFQLNTALDKENNPTDWMRHWENDARVAVSIHKDTLKEIKTNPKTDSLALQQEILTGSKGEYIALRIVKYQDAEETL